MEDEFNVPGVKKKWFRKDLAGIWRGAKPGLAQRKVSRILPRVRQERSAAQLRSWEMHFTYQAETVMFAQIRCTWWETGRISSLLQLWFLKEEDDCSTRVTVERQPKNLDAYESAAHGRRLKFLGFQSTRRLPFHWTIQPLPMEINRRLWTVAGAINTVPGGGPVRACFDQVQQVPA